MPPDFDAWSAPRAGERSVPGLGGWWLMILSMESALRIVFSIYAVFWVVVFIALFFGVGILLKRAERKTSGPAHGTPGSGH